MSPMGLSGSGTRDRLVTIEQVTEGIGTSRHPTESWTTLTTVQARREDATGLERFAAHQESAPFDTKWELPYVATCDPELVNVAKVRRLVHAGRVYDIVYSEIIGRKRGILVYTMARQG